jgi:proline dehydrogenase
VRRILLWAARNRWLRYRVPRMWFAKRAVRRFMPGEQLSDALDAAERLKGHGIGALLTHLGENLVDAPEADAVAAHYLDALEQVRARGIDGEMSVKLTQLGLDLDRDLAKRHLASMAVRARELDAGVVWIDMEGSAYTEATVALYERLRTAHARTGICLQAYLHRTAADVERLRRLDPAIRLVKGAYDEPAAVAFQDRRAVDASYAALAVGFLAGSRDRPVRLGLGTHDVALIELIAGQLAALGIAKEAFEIEMLFGIRAGEQRRLVRAGYRVQTLIAYGDAWYPWYMRRLAERPANVVFALRSILP